MNRLHRLALGIGAPLVVAACGGGGGTSPGPVSIVTPSPVPTASPTTKPTPSPTPPSVTIAVSKSTNTHAYTIVLQTTGSASVTQNGYEGTTTIPASDSATFFKDLNANVPVDDVQTNDGCTKSASYGTTTLITYEGQTTGDVSCPPSDTSPAYTLYQDTLTVERAMEANLGSFTH